MDLQKCKLLSKKLISPTLPTRLFFYELQDRFGQHLYETYCENEPFSLPEVERSFLYIYRKQIPIDMTHFRKWVGLITNIYIQNEIIICLQSKNKDSLMYTLSPLWKEHFEKIAGTTFIHFQQKSQNHMVQEKNYRRTKAIGTLSLITFFHLKKGLNNNNDISKTTGFNKQRIGIVLSIFKGLGIVKDRKERKGSIMFRKNIVEILPYLNGYNQKVIKLRQQRRALVKKGDLLMKKLQERLNQENHLGINTQEEISKTNVKLSQIFKKREKYITKVDYIPNLSEFQPKRYKKIVVRKNKRLFKSKRTPSLTNQIIPQQVNQKIQKKAKKEKEKKIKTTNKSHFENNKLRDLREEYKRTIQKIESLHSSEETMRNKNPKIKKLKSLQDSLQNGSIQEVNIAQALLSLSPSPKPNQKNLSNQTNLEKLHFEGPSPEIPDFCNTENILKSPLYYPLSPKNYCPTSISPPPYMTNLSNMGNCTYNIQSNLCLQPKELWELLMREWKNQQHQSYLYNNQINKVKAPPHTRTLHHISTLDQTQKQTQTQTHYFLKQPFVSLKPNNILQHKKQEMQTQRSPNTIKFQLNTQRLPQPPERKLSPFKDQQPNLLSNEYKPICQKQNEYNYPPKFVNIELHTGKPMDRRNDYVIPENFEFCQTQTNNDIQAKFIPNFSNKWFNN
ncbi:hypothetical protein M0812_08181 [Anaeramoeba flamelloides]|uniref:Uncharacterized protein n=1 Tax=Anaeramoeba flamelloides TaxID=1746091 RepID=A0AAV8A1C4_9EUKA|nr:hypothetical protein M0812_08181 [Anaeramoeba flamelloides]